MEKHAVSRLIGAPPGYVGYDEVRNYVWKVSGGGLSLSGPESFLLRFHTIFHTQFPSFHIHRVVYSRMPSSGAPTRWYSLTRLRRRMWMCSTYCCRCGLCDATAIKFHTEGCLKNPNKHSCSHP